METSRFFQNGPILLDIFWGLILMDTFGDFLSEFSTKFIRLNDISHNNNKLIESKILLKNPWPKNAITEDYFNFEAEKVPWPYPFTYKVHSTVWSL